MDQSNTPTNMKLVEKKSGLPILAFGAVWVGYALLFPLYKLSHYIIAGVVSLAAYLLLNRVIPAKAVYVPDVKPPVSTGDQTADQLLAEGDDLLAQIGRCRAGLAKSSVAQKIQRLESLVASILAFVRQNPQAAPDLRKFMGYYLPTLLKLVESYRTFESQGIGGENIGATMTKIEGMLDTMATAFERQLDALFADTALDISTDITVMEGMLTQEGLQDGQNTLKF